MEDVSLISLLGRVALSMVVVLGVMGLAAAALRRRVGGALVTARGTVPQLEVVARQGLGRTTSVTIVRAGDQDMILGVTETSVTLLAARPVEQPEEPIGPEAPGTVPRGSHEGSTSAWMAALDNLRERTVRRS